MKELRNKIKAFVVKLFCKHDWVKVGFREEIENNVRFSVRHYKCVKCGKELWVDGRDDYIEYKQFWRGNK